MKHKKSIDRIIIALLLVLSMCGSFLSVAPVEAQKEQETMEQEKSTEENTENASEDTKEESAKENKVEKSSNENSKKDVIAPLEGNSENSVENETQNEDEPFTMKVTFDGSDLAANSENNITDVWSGNTSKMMTVVISRNKNVTVDSDKQYVLCMKTSNVFYFNGVPEAEKITGAEEVAMVKNPTPTVNKSGGQEGSLDGFSNYSGEIRIKLNSAVEKITIPDVGISYNLRLLGFNGTSAQKVSNPFQVEIDSVDSGISLSQISENDKKNLQQVKVQSIMMKTGSLSSTNWKSAMSTDYFNKAILMQPVTLGKDGHISYYFGTAGVERQVYKSMTIVVKCPFIEVNGEKHYLEVATDDIALKENKKQDEEKIRATGYKMKDPAVYNEEEHTITYTFENIYLGGHTPLLYTPEFSWPSDLKEELEDDQSYTIKGVSFEVTEQTGYLGFTSTLKSNFTQPDSYSATFLPKQVNVKMASSKESGSDVAKRYIYHDLTRENGNEGTLGFFDIHNDGTEDSSLLKVEYKFNTGSDDKAIYYVTRVNLAVYGNTNGTDVSYVLSDGENEISGKKHYNNQSSFFCRIKDLRQNSGVSDSYYIKSISYQTYLQKGTSYHAETAHLKRNREADSGLFFGYLEGELNTTASATLKISAADGKTSITSEGKTEVSSTEVSTVSDQDYIGMAIGGVNIGGANSQAVTAGGSATLNVSGTISSEEYPMPSSINVNGYHVLRDGILYICLPEGISIAGKEQITITSNGNKVDSEAPKRIPGAFNVGNVSAYWWEIPIKGLNTKSGNTVKATIELSTSESMAGLVWNFSNCIALRANGQSVSWASANSESSVYNTTDELDKIDVIKNLSDYLKQNGQTKNLGIVMFNQTGNVRLNVARAEAKLDVATALSTSESKTSDESVAISKEDSDITYDVTVSCTEDGAAKDFYYYIPIVRKDSEIDTSALVGKKEVGLQLKDAVSITKTNSSDTDTGNESVPFEINYTTASDLNSTSIQGSTITWEKDCEDYSKVTAVRIKTKDDASLKQGEEYQFLVRMNYDNSSSDFEKQAGSVASWRSFGRYTYTRNNATTINSYPSGSNSVKIRYVKDMTESPIMLNLDTSKTENNVDASKILPTKFVNEQKLKIKSVTPSNGTQLVQSETDNLTGADANSKFKMVFNLNNSGSAMVLPSVGAGWTIQKENQITLQAKVYFSKALTDVTTERYVDIVLGNDDIDIKCRVKLQRTVAAASADGSGLALGEQFQVPQVNSKCSISRDSAFTALYVIQNFVPGNYSNQILKWKKSDGTESNFPSGTTITMMEVNEDSKVESYWYCTPTGSSIDLNSFTRMSGTAKYSYNTSATNSTTLRYLFVVDFGQAKIKPEIGDYQLVFDANATNGAPAFKPVALDVTLGETKNYTLKSTEVKKDIKNPSAEINYTVAEADGNDSYSEGRSMSLVLTPTGGTTLPSDAKIVIGNETYTCNSNKDIVIPVGTIQNGSTNLKLTSQMFPDEEQEYSFDAKLVLSNSSHAETPGGGKTVANCTVNFSKAQKELPALKVTGTRIADQNAWSTGQKIDIQMKNIEDYTVTVTAYSGLSGNSKVTDIISSVSGIFTIQNGVGTYVSGQNSTGKLVLSSTAKSGTYRLVFEVKNTSGEVLMTVPYYFIVQ